jgi:hypothetical protein
MKRFLVALVAAALVAGCHTRPDPYCPGGKVIISPFPCPSGHCAVFDMPVRNQEQYDRMVADRNAATQASTQHVELFPTTTPTK